MDCADKIFNYIAGAASIISLFLTGYTYKKVNKLYNTIENNDINQSNNDVINTGTINQVGVQVKNDSKRIK